MPTASDTPRGTNVLVAQSGGPTAVINASLQGVVDRCRREPDRFGRIFAGEYGIEGILQERLLDLDAEDPREMARLRRTPGAGAIGSCRYKLEEENHQDLERVVQVMRAHGIGWFFYIGGNDSMDTAAKISAAAEERGLPLSVVGVPKTIDNDVGDDAFELVDHTPGYGSTARFWASIVQVIDEENRGMAWVEPVTVVQAMGRRSGFIPAAARLADPARALPLHIYTAESGYDLPAMADFVSDELRRSGRCIVVVSEGFDVRAAGDLALSRDAFGHCAYGTGRTSVAQRVVTYLNQRGLPVPGHAVGQVPGVLQRSTDLFASSVDAEEAYRVGVHAVECAAAGKRGVMATLQREGGGRSAVGRPYRVILSDVPLAAVANIHRTLPPEWLAPDRPDVTDAFVAYARPLIGDRPADVEWCDGWARFARLRRVRVPTLLAPYRPQHHRNHRRSIQGEASTDTDGKTAQE